jgi:hypothetical protein
VKHKTGLDYVEWVRPLTDRPWNASIKADTHDYDMCIYAEEGSLEGHVWEGSIDK